MSEIVIRSVQTERLDRLFRDLHRISGADYKQIIRSEGGKILRLCVDYTKTKRTRSKIAKGLAKSFNTFSPDNNGVGRKATEGTHFVLWTSARSGRGFISKNNRQKWALIKSGMSDRNGLANGGERALGQPANSGWGYLHWDEAKGEQIRRSQPDLTPDDEQVLQLWNKAIRNRNKIFKERLEAAVKAIGLTAGSWVQAADSAGLDIGSSAYITKARNAVPSSGRRYQNGKTRQEGNASQFLLTIINSMPILVNGIKRKKRSGGNTELDGWKIINRAIKTRRSAFLMDLRKGVFADLETRARRYPGIFTR